MLSVVPGTLFFYIFLFVSDYKSKMLVGVK